LRHKIAFRINSGGNLVARSANRGVPLIVEHPTHPVSQQIIQIADFLFALVSKK
jgi:MinD-like ATPase involved in chromosome partitioning or flagellar assembly